MHACACLSKRRVARPLLLKRLLPPTLDAHFGRVRDRHIRHLPLQRNRRTMRLTDGRRCRCTGRALLEEQQLTGVARVLSEPVLSPHDGVIARWRLLSREVTLRQCFGDLAIHRERFDLVQREQSDAVRHLVTHAGARHQSPFRLGVAHLGARQVT